MSSEKNQGNVIGGLKAAINNPNVSEEAKQRDFQRLQEMGADVEGYSAPSGGQQEGGHAYGQGDQIDGKDASRVIGGYKATLSNPRTSEAAKEHAEEVLEELDAK
ncbi:Conidiation protein 6-domain-containing protein [Ephemerocybe angulata]|uniref:Conidiation protein 6-domain-containing protein n=1 Tax=Ephemerocybe angulata TaxID=980116 RepID=A0A8H6M3B7_9AGAR|nr:Conidiation protein 6-domain-containing protein [Tulosesus angulatus]